MSQVRNLGYRRYPVREGKFPDSEKVREAFLIALHGRHAVPTADPPTPLTPLPPTPPTPHPAPTSAQGAGTSRSANTDPPRGGEGGGGDGKGDGNERKGEGEGKEKEKEWKGEGKEENEGGGGAQLPASPVAPLRLRGPINVMAARWKGGARARVASFFC